jgi:hypothetical protein
LSLQRRHHRANRSRSQLCVRIENQQKLTARGPSPKVATTSIANVFRALDEIDLWKSIPHQGLRPVKRCAIDHNHLGVTAQSLMANRLKALGEIITRIPIDDDDRDIHGNEFSVFSIH